MIYEQKIWNYNINNKTQNRRSIHWLFQVHVSHSLQMQCRPSNTNLQTSSLSRCLSSLKSVLHLEIFPPMWKSQNLCSFVKNILMLWVGETRVIWRPEQNFGFTGTEFFKTHKLGNVPWKLGRIGFLYTEY